VSEPVVTDDGYDVVIVGAGIAGATAAKVIADHGGKRILILEAGRSTGMSSDKYRSHVTAYHEALAKVPNSPYADNPNAPQPSVLSIRQLLPGPTAGRAPTTVPDTGGYFVQTGPLPFSSDYTRALGGTTLHWLGTCLRMLPNDFSLRSAYGHGVDWPIGYGDLRGFYERAEREVIGVAGDVADQRYPGIDGTYFGGYEYPMERIPPS
jgi:choline dehydrogenase-like flavoprotein